jgi:hypothetical protein
MVDKNKNAILEKSVKFLNACVHLLRSLADAVGGVGQFFD